MGLCKNDHHCGSGGPCYQQCGTDQCKDSVGIHGKYHPGDKVEIIDGKVYINDSETPLEDSYVPETPLGSFGPYEVPENCYFMMGDNRNNSKDSRYWTNTFVRFDQIVGKAEIRYFPSIKLLN